MSVERETVQVEPESTTNLVEVRVAADPTQLPVLRAVVADLAMRADFDVDSVADLRLAVDEACSCLVRLANSDTQLHCRFRTWEDALSLSAEVASEDGFGPRKDTFSWRVLSALADSVSASVEADTSTNGRYRVRIELTKGRTAHV
ncbi:anti-sigma regulatory factor [Salinifilum aidingensis]